MSMSIIELNKYCEEHNKYVVCGNGKYKGLFSIWTNPKTGGV